MPDFCPVKQDQYNRLIKQAIRLIVRRRRRIDGGSDDFCPVIIALAGIPGAGKTTLAKYIARDLSRRLIDGAAVAAADVSLDGYHLYRSELDALPMGVYRDNAHVRRGAPFTFNPGKYLRDLETLRATGAVSFPSFAHEKKDPVEKDIRIDGRPSAGKKYGDELIIIEGLYTLLRGDEQDAGWPDADSSAIKTITSYRARVASMPPITEADKAHWFKCQSFYDLTISINLDLSSAIERLVQRHMRAWSIPREIAAKRAGGSDYDNALVVLRSLKNAQYSLQSVDIRGNHL